MNSTYGKTIQKAIDTELVYKAKKAVDKKGNEYDAAARYNLKNSALIKEFYDVGSNIICFEVDKAIDKFFVPNFIGVQIQQ